MKKEYKNNLPFILHRKVAYSIVSLAMIVFDIADSILNPLATAIHVCHIRRSASTSLITLRFIRYHILSQTYIDHCRNRIQGAVDDIEDYQILEEDTMVCCLKG